MEEILRDLLKRKILHDIHDLLEEYPVQVAFAYIDGKVKMEMAGKDRKGYFIFYFKFPVRIGFRARTEDELNSAKRDAETLEVGEPILICALWELNSIPIEQLLQLPDREQGKRHSEVV